MKYDFDIDIDCADRTQILEIIPHIPASIKKDENFTKHNTGVYFQDIPTLPLEGYSAIDHKDAEQTGWFKVDFLNNYIYKDVKNEAHLNKLLNTDPLWELLQHQEIVSKLYHVNNYIDILQEYKPQTVEELAIILAIIRPAKRHLQGLSFNEIRKTVWEKPVDEVYYFKKAHAIAFASAIVVQLNLLCEQLED